MGLSDIVRGVVRAELCAAFPESFLNACAGAGIRIRNLERTDACTLRFELCENDWEAVRRTAQMLQAECRVLEKSGGRSGRAWLRRRAVLFLSLLFAGALLLWSELHIWQIEVRGCEKLSCGQVLRALEDSGVGVGSYWPSISVDAVRGRMLLQLPELAWMTVNINGSRAVVSVVERKEKPEIYLESAAADVRASRTGILRELTVLNGHPLVQRGKAVVEGETLVTGSLDSLSHPTRCVRAEAQAMADTWYEWIAVDPDGVKKEGKNERAFGCLALQIGKKRANLLTGSRKELDGYDKIIKEYTVGIKGLFALPLTLIREEYRRGWSEETTELSAADRLRVSLAEQIEGEILQAHFSSAQRDGFRYTTMRAHCLENIAQTAEYDAP